MKDSLQIVAITEKHITPILELSYDGPIPAIIRTAWRLSHMDVEDLVFPPGSTTQSIEREFFSGAARFDATAALSRLKELARDLGDVYSWDLRVYLYASGTDNELVSIGGEPW